jgi:UDP-glucose 4-epimerase
LPIKNEKYLSLCPILSFQKNMKILLTGGAGYLGTEIATALAQRSDISEILIYDNLSRTNHYNFFLGHRLPSQKIRFVQGEMLDSRRLNKASMWSIIWPPK